jgi:indole-3-glycerol phosphate synthase
MKLRKEFIFFTYLLESYATYKGDTASHILQVLDEKKLTDFVYDMYEMYHSEAIENAFADLDSLIATGKPAW